MPTYPKHGCGHTGCPQLVARGVARCPEHEKKQKVEVEAQRGTAHERGYNHRWAKARLTYLASHPLCVKCLKEGRTTAARVVDHVVPHLGDQALFWDVNNWQALCDFTSPYNCHGSKTGKESNQRGR